MIRRRPPTDRPVLLFVFGAILSALTVADTAVALSAWSSL